VPFRIEFRYEFRATVDSGVGGDPELAIETGWLAFGKGFTCRSEQRVAEGHGSVGPRLPGIRAARRKEIDERLQQRPIHRGTVALEDSDDAAQCTRVSMIGPSKGAK
jgi:hypothetical protein